MSISGIADASWYVKLTDARLAALQPFLANPPDILYHYTSAEACFEILDAPIKNSDDRGLLWASSAFCTNDSTEVATGIESVKNVAGEYVPSEKMESVFAHNTKGEYTLWTFLETACLVSFTGQKDQLSQWREYGHRSKGVAIGFNRHRIGMAAAPLGFKLVPVLYEEHDKKDVLHRFFKKAAEIAKEPEFADNAPWFWERVLSQAFLVALGCKNGSFREEKEWRLIAPQPPDIRFRKGPFGVIPYSLIPIKGTVAELWLGPMIDAKMSARTWRIYLDRTYGVTPSGESLVAIHRSEIPLRKL